MNNAPNFFDDPTSYSFLTLGGVRISQCTLIKINDLATVDAWKAQKSRETSGQIEVYNGTTRKHPKFTFAATKSADFYELRRVWKLLAPVPGHSVAIPPATATNAAGANSGSDASNNAVGSLDAADQSTAGEGALDSINTQNTTASTNTSVGPRPPTVPAQNGFLACHNITAVARGEWDGPYTDDTNGLLVHLTFVPQDPPTPAGAGAMTPANATGLLASLAQNGGGPGGGGGSILGALTGPDAASGM